MASAIPSAQELDSLLSKLRKVQTDAAAKKKLAPRTYSLQSASLQNQQSLAKLGQMVGEVVNLAKSKPDFAKKYALQVEAAKKLQATLQVLAGDHFADIMLGPILSTAVPLITGLLQAAKVLAVAPVRSINDQVSDLLKQIFTGGDMGPNSAAVKHAVQVDMPSRGKTIDALRAYLLSSNGSVKAWYRLKFALR